MGTWAVDDPKTQVVVANGDPIGELVKLEKEMYRLIEALETQLKRIDDERPSKKEKK